MRQLAEFQTQLPTLQQNKIEVYAVSSDSADKAKGTVEKHGLTYPVMYGIDPQDLAKQWGSHWEEARNILHATGFLLLPDNTIGTAVYATGAIGRLTSNDVLRLVRDSWKHKHLSFSLP